MTRKIKWNKKELNSGKDSSGVSNIDNISGKHQGISQGYTHGSLTKGLVAYYPMERGKGQIIRDAALNSLGNLHGQTDGPEWSDSSVAGSHSLKFEAGNEDHVSIGSFWIPAEGTITCWYKTSNSSRQACVGTVDDDLLRFNINYKPGTGGSTEGWLGFNANFNELSPGSNVGSVIYDGNWHHFAVVWDGEQQSARIYFDGEQQTIDHWANQDTFAGEQGELVIGNEDSEEYHDGNITECRIYNRKLSKKEIEALYNLSRPNGVEVTEGDVPSQSDGGISRWKFDDDQDTDTATDSWGGNDGSIKGAVYTSERVYGSNALDLDGSSNFVRVDSSGFSDVGSFTISAWVNSSNQTGSANMFWDTDFNTDSRFGILNYDNRVRVHMDSVDGGYFDINQSVIDGGWNHIILTRTEGESAKFYINGELVRVDKTDDGTLLGSEGNSTIGVREDEEDHYFEGQIDDIRFYDRALTPVEVEKLFKKGSHRISRGDTLQ